MDPVDGALFVFSAPSAVVARFVEDDPYVRHGIVTSFEIKRWTARVTHNGGRAAPTTIEASHSVPTNAAAAFPFPLANPLDLGALDPFEDRNGPFSWTLNEDGTVLAHMAAGPSHANDSGAMHGGALCLFADFAACGIARGQGFRPSWRGAASHRVVTVSLHCDFVSALNLSESPVEHLTAQVCLLGVRCGSHVLGC